MLISRQASYWSLYPKPTGLTNAVFKISVNFGGPSSLSSPTKCKVRMSWVSVSCFQDFSSSHIFSAFSGLLLNIALQRVPASFSPNTVICRFIRVLTIYYSMFIFAYEDLASIEWFYCQEHVTQYFYYILKMLRENNENFFVSLS